MNEFLLKFSFVFIAAMSITCGFQAAKGKVYTATEDLDFEEITSSNYPGDHAWYQSMQNKYPEKCGSKRFAVEKMSTQSTSWRQATKEAGDDIITYIVMPRSFLGSDVNSAWGELEMLYCLGDIPDNTTTAKLDKNNFPNLYLWLGYMQEKYPNIDFAAFGFVAGACWAMYHDSDIELPVIVCPFDSIKNGLTEADEFCFLHEVGHVQNHKRWRFFYNDKKFALREPIALGFTGLVLYTTGFLGSTKEALLNPYSTKIAVIGLSLALGYATYSAIQQTSREIILRFDERYADRFARQQSDKAALLGGIAMFKDNAADYERILSSGLKLKNALGNYWVANKLVDLVICLTFLKDCHPTYESRINAIEKELQERSNI